MSFCILLFPFGWDISIIFQANEAFRAQISRVCAVAQYAVLEANARVNGRGSFSHPTPPKPLNQFRCHVKYITVSPQGVDVQNLVGIDSAVTDLRMREKKTRFVWIFYYPRESFREG